MEFPEVDFPEGVYADVRFERVTSTQVVVRDRQIDDATARTVTGAFLRVLRHGRWYYASTTDLRSVSARLADLARSDAIRPHPAPKDVVARLVPHVADVRRYTDASIERVPLRDKIALLESRFGAFERPLIRSWLAVYADSHSVRRFVSSRGADVTRDQQSAGYALRFTMADGDRTFSDGKTAAAERFEELDPTRDGFEAYLDDSERFVRHAEAVTPGDYPVLLAPPVAGVFAHESFGHKSEADFMLGDPSMLEEWRIGKPIGAPILSIVDDGDMPGTGFTAYDDEGQPAQRTFLIREGLLAGRLHSASTAAELDEAVTGNARAMDLSFEPIVRMTTTCILPGDSTRDELVSSIDDGFYIQNMKHGSGMSTFTIAPSLAWRIRGGRITEPVRISLLTGSVFETLGLIDGVSNELGLVPSVVGGCGKMEQFPLPVSFGGPHVRVSRMAVA